MLQISGKQTYSKGIETMNPINAKCVQLIELHAFAYCLLCICLVALFHLLKIGVLDSVVCLLLAAGLLTSACTVEALCVCTRLCAALVHLG